MNDGSKEPQEQDDYTEIHYVPKIITDYELLWSCISKIRNESSKEGV